MLNLFEAQKIVDESAERLGASLIGIDDARECILAEDIVSGIDVAPFRNSAMDGVAVRAEWLRDCSVDNKMTLPVATTVFAGSRGHVESTLDGMQAVKIMTGAPIPSHCDAVVKIEDVCCDDQNVTFSSAALAGTNIRRAGEDIKRGEALFSTGRAVSPLDIGILASVGLKRVPVYRKPTLSVITTGDELTEPGQALQPGEIYNSNKYAIDSLVGAFCERMDGSSVVGDAIEELAAALDTDSDVVVSTGGVSAGEKDYVIRAAESVGWQTIFHKVSIKPGKPFYFAHRKSQLLFGLPGNPLSAAVTCAMFVIPALKKMMGRRNFQPLPVPALLDSDYRKTGGRTLIWPGKIWREGVETHAAFSDKKSSASLTALLDSDGLLIQYVVEKGSKNDRVGALPWAEILG